MRSKKSRNKKIAPKIIRERENKIDTDPVLISAKKIVDENGIEDEILEVEIYCPIDKKEFLKSDCTEITAMVGKKDVDQIKREVKTTSMQTERLKAKPAKKDESIKYKNKNTIEKDVQNKRRNSKTPGKKLAKPKDINKALRKAPANKNKNVRESLKDYKKVGKFSFVPTEKDLPKKTRKQAKPLSVKRVSDYEKKIFGEKKVVRPVPVSLPDIKAQSGAKKDDLARKSNIGDFRVSFEKFYNRSLESAKIDVGSIFQESYNKTSFKEKVNGNSQVSSKRKHPMFHPVFSGIRSEILLLSPTKYKFVTEKQVQKVGKIKTTMRISRKTLLKKQKSDNANIILQSKNKTGKNIQSKSMSFSIKDLMKQKTKESQKFDLGVSRTLNGISSVSISKNKKEKTSISLFAKPVQKMNLPNQQPFQKINEEINVKNSADKIKDGSKEASVRNKKKQFKPGQDVFYRGTLNFNEENFSNLKCVVDRSKRSKSENTPNFVVTCKINQASNSIDLLIGNIPSNILKIKPVKQKFKGRSLTDMQNLLNEEGIEVDYRFVSKGRSLTISDHDTDDGESYKYSFYCMMKNGETKLLPKSVIETFEVRSEIVNVKNISITTTAGRNEKSDDEDDDYNNVEVKGDFSINKIKTESDKILQTLFGSLFDLFQKDLEATIKDLQGLIYSIEVVRINKTTGDTKTIDRVLVEEGKSSTFSDRINESDTVYYKFIPRVIPAADAISRVNDKIKLLGPKEVFKKINNGFASNRKNALNREIKTVSKIGNKFSNRNVFSKGRIQTPEDEFEKTGFDFFSQSSTGDIFYSGDVTSVVRSGNSNEYKILGSRIEEIKHFKESIDNINDKKKKQQQLFKVQVTTNDDYDVDFYMIFVKENNDVYLNGIMNSTDSVKPRNTYNYLVEHKGSLGQIEYYIVGVFKNGIIGTAKKIGTHIIE